MTEDQERHDRRVARVTKDYQEAALAVREAAVRYGEALVVYVTLHADLTTPRLTVLNAAQALAQEQKNAEAACESFRLHEGRWLSAVTCTVTL